MPNAMPVTEPVVRSLVLRATSSAIARAGRRLHARLTGAASACLTALTTPTQGFASAIDSG